MGEFEQFSTDELKDLRQELVAGGLDVFQSGLLLSSFLATKGYGVSTDQARQAITRIESARCTLPKLQEELERLAFVM